MRLGTLAAYLGAELRGDPEAVVERVESLDHASPGALTFLSDSRYLRSLTSTRASAVILSGEFADASPCASLVVDNPHLAFAKAAQLLYPVKQDSHGVHPTAVVDEGVVINSGVSIGAHCVIEAGVRIACDAVIGPGCLIHENSEIGEASVLVSGVTIRAAKLGRRVFVHAGAVIGSDGFGYARDGDHWFKVPQLGRVIIGDDVEIGANTAIDRGALNDTIIGNGVKIDNQVQVAHNVRIGDDTAIAGCVGIAGSAVIGRRCAIGGGAGILGHLEITDDVTITAMSLVTRSIREPGSYSSGTALQPTPRWRRNGVHARRLDEYVSRLESLERLSRNDEENGKG